VTIVFDRPAQAEVRIPIHAFLYPQGRGADPRRRTVRDHHQKARAPSGRSTSLTPDAANWTIKGHHQQEPEPRGPVWFRTRRDAANVNYQTAPFNERRRPGRRIPRSVDARHRRPPAILIFPSWPRDGSKPNTPFNPEIISLGNLAPGERKTVNVVIRGKKAVLDRED